MRIAHVIDSMDIGGAEIMVQSLCHQHRAEGHEVSVHCLFSCGILGETLQEQGFDVVTHGPASYPRLIARLARSFLTLRPDVVHCHNVVASVIGAVSGRFARAKSIICTRHGIVSRPRNYRRQGLFWLAARCADRVVAVCPKAEANLARATFAQPWKLVTIWNGAKPASVSGPGAAEPPSESKHAFNIVTVARLGPPKDHATLVRALSKVRQVAPAVRLWIVGDGPMKSQLQRLAADLDCAENVTFLGARSDVGDWLARSHLFVLSSISEGVPISLLEAMAAGLPSVVTDVGGMGDVVMRADAGHAVPPGDVDAMAEAIVAYQSDPAFRQRHAENARRGYERYFSFERMASAYMFLYQDPRQPLQRNSALERTDTA
jgi:L-malate glycosyltransferase